MVNSAREAYSRAFNDVSVCSGDLGGYGECDSRCWDWILRGESASDRDLTFLSPY